MGVLEDPGMNYHHALTLWRASPSAGRINTLSLDVITRKEARDCMHITPGRSNNWTFLLGIIMVLEFSRVLGRGSSDSSSFITRNFSSSSDSSPHIRSFSRVFLERCVSASSENHLHRRAISWRRLAFSIVIFCTSTPVQCIFVEELCYDNIISILLNLATTWVSCPY